MISFPSDDIILTTFKRISVWNLNNTTNNIILDITFCNGILKDFMRSKYENNYFYVNKDLNLLIKISQNVIIIIIIILINYLIVFLFPYLEYFVYL
jgi:hypothetical protein